MKIMKGMKKMKFNAKKFLSRKFIVTILTDILGVVLLLSDLGGKLGAIMGIVAIVLTSIIYIISEATIDSKGVTLTNITEEVLKDIKEIKPIIKEIKKLNEDTEDVNK